jgi:hypothetical protein
MTGVVHTSWPLRKSMLYFPSQDEITTFPLPGLFPKFQTKPRICIREKFVSGLFHDVIFLNQTCNLVTAQHANLRQTPRVWIKLRKIVGNFPKFRDSWDSFRHDCNSQNLCVIPIKSE